MKPSEIYKIIDSLQQKKILTDPFEIQIVQAIKMNIELGEEISCTYMEALEGIIKNNARKI